MTLNCKSIFVDFVVYSILLAPSPPRPQKPGDKGWVGRARVPMPSTKGYVVRPKWNTEQDYLKKGSSKKTLNRYEKQLRKSKQDKMKSKGAHAMPISVEGRRMPL